MEHTAAYLPCWLKMSGSSRESSCGGGGTDADAISELKRVPSLQLSLQPTQSAQLLGSRSLSGHHDNGEMINGKNGGSHSTVVRLLLRRTVKDKSIGT